MLNRAELIGRLGRNPELTYSQSGLAICKFTVATTDYTKDKEERTEWHTCTAFGRTAEVCGEYLHKGKLVYIDGKIQTSSWDQDGTKRYKTEIIVNNMKMLSSKDNDNHQNQADSSQKSPFPDDEPGDIPF